LLSIGKHGEAIGVLQKLHDAFPDVSGYRNELALAHRTRGYTHLDNREFDRALADLNEAIRLNLEDDRAYSGRGLAYAGKGDSRQAMRDCDHAIQLRPDDGWDYWMRGRAYEELGNLDEAVASQEESLRVQPDGTGALCALVSIHLDRSEFDEAMVVLGEAIRLKPNRGNCWYYQALARLGADDLDGYRSDCTGILEHFGQTEDPVAAEWAAWTCVLAPDAVADFSGPVALAEKAVQSDPKSSRYLKALGSILYRAGRYEEAIQRLTESDRLVQDPDPESGSSHAYTWFFLAMAHHKLGHDAEAKQWLDKAVGWLDNVMRRHDDGTGARLSWNRRLTLKLLRQEAEALVKPSGASGKPDTPPAEKEKSEKPRRARRKKQEAVSLKDRANETVFQQRCVEIDQETDSLAAQTQVGEQLSFVQRVEGFDGLQFQDYLVLNDDVKLVSTIQLDALVLHGQRNLAPEGQVAQAQLVAKALLMCRLQQSWAEVPMDLGCRGEDFIRQFFVDQHRPMSFVFSVSSVPPW